VARKLRGSAPPLFGEGLGPHLTQSRLPEAYVHIKWHLDASSRLATLKMARKLKALPPFWGGEMGPDLAQCGLD